MTDHSPAPEEAIRDPRIGEAPNRIDRDDRGNLDDIVLTNITMLHMEWMDDNLVWMRCYRDDGPSDVVFHLSARGKISGRYEVEPPAAKNAAWNRRAGGERERELAAWISENSYELAMAVVGAYEMAPNGSGIDHSLAYAGDALMAMIKGERDPFEAVRKVIPAGRLWKEETHWLPRWQSGEAKVVVDTPSPRAALARQTEGERNGG